MFPRNLLWLVTLLGFLSTCHSKNYSDYRLPRNHTPKNYVVKLNIDPNSTEFSGEVEITFSTRNKTNSIHLHSSATQLTINKVILNAHYPCNVSSVDNDTDIAHIICDEAIEKIDNNTIYLKFDGLYADVGVGLYREEYTYLGQTEHNVATQFEATDARKAFPCFDEPQLKAKFNITIVHPLNCTALSNTPVKNETIGESSIITTFKRTPTMSTYLLAFVVTKDSKNETSKENPDAFPVNVYYKPYKLYRIGTPVRYGGILVHAHSVYMGIEYNKLGDSKMDFIAIGGFGGAMENWGLVIYDDNSLLDEYYLTTPDHKQFIIETMAHELAHQWFGNYVTLKWWSEVWLNEAFAQFFGMHYDEKLVGTAMDLERQFVTLYLHNGLDADEISVNPLSNKNEDIYTPDDCNDKFDDISYNKGASIVRMMRSILGKENFQKAIQKYLSDNKLKNTVGSTVLNTFGSFYNNTNYTFEELLHNYIYERGYPIVSVSLNADGKSVEIKQEVNAENTQWYIPISYTTSQKKNFTVRVDEWLFGTPLNIKVKNNSWIVVNLQETGFFRVRYDTVLLKRIIDTLKSTKMNDIHVTNRAQILDDTFKLFETNVSLALAEYVKNDTEYEPWFVVKNRITQLINNMTANGQDENVKELKNRTLGWIHQAFPKAINVTTHLQNKTRTMMDEFKAFLGDSTILEQAQNIYKEYLANGKIQDINTKMALCYGFKMSETPRTDFDILLKLYQEEISGYARKQILSALGCANDQEILKMYLSEILSLNSRISKSHIKDVFSAVYNNNNNGLNVFLTFLSERLDEINEKYGKSLKFGNILKDSAKNIYTEEQLLKMKSVVNKQQKLSNRKIVPSKVFELVSNRISRTNQNIIYY